MAKFTSRADLLIAAGESIKMQINAGVNEPVFKFDGKIEFAVSYNYNSKTNDYEFPLAVVEGKPVFVGDELYCKDGCKHIIASVSEEGLLVEKNARSSLFTIDFMSWNPPKPKTVMVELLRGDAEWMVRAYDGCNSKAGRIAESCCKALEKA